MKKNRRMQKKVALRMAAAFAVGAAAGLSCVSVTAAPEEEQIVETRIVYLEKASEEDAEEKDPEKVYTYLGNYKITAYCACEICCGEWANNRPVDSNGCPVVYTASGERAVSGMTVAVDPEVIPYGTTILIAGKEYTAQDCGGAIKGKRIDVYFDSHMEAQDYGVQTHDVYALEIR